MSTMPTPRRNMGVALEEMLKGVQPIDMTSGMDMPAAPKPRSKGQMIAGIISDALAGAVGQRGDFADTLDRERAQQQQDVLWSRRQAADDAQWMRRQQWERDNRAPTYFEDNAGNRWMTDPKTGENKMVFRDTTPKMNFVADGLGGGMWVAAPTAPVATAGAADLPPGYTVRKRGGAGGNTSGGFR